MRLEHLKSGRRCVEMKTTVADFQVEDHERRAAGLLGGLPKCVPHRKSKENGQNETVTEGKWELAVPLKLSKTEAWPILCNERETTKGTP